MLDSVLLVPVDPTDQHVVQVVDRESGVSIPLGVVDSEEEAQETAAAVKRELDRLLAAYEEMLQGIDFLDLTSTREEELGGEIMETAEYFWFHEFPWQIEDYVVKYTLIYKPRFKEASDE